MLCRFFFSSRRRHTRFDCDWSSDVCSSDLARPMLNSARRYCTSPLHFRARRFCRRCASDASYESVGNAGSIDVTTTDIALRSEEHTSELQSQSNLVCRLLLEKKKTTVTSMSIFFSWHLFPSPVSIHVLGASSPTTVDSAHVLSAVLLSSMFFAAGAHLSTTYC